MTEKKPPDWDNDPLSVLFRDAEQNDRVTALEFPEAYELLGDLPPRVVPPTKLDPGPTEIHSKG